MFAGFRSPLFINTLLYQCESMRTFVVVCRALFIRGSVFEISFCIFCITFLISLFNFFILSLFSKLFSTANRFERSQPFAVNCSLLVVSLQIGVNVRSLSQSTIHYQFAFSLFSEELEKPKIIYLLYFTDFQKHQITKIFLSFAHFLCTPRS